MLDVPPSSLRCGDPTSQLLQDWRGFLILRIDIVQRAIDGQFTQHDHLLDAQQGIAVGAVQKSGEVTGHDTGGGEGFAGVDE